MQNIKIGKRNLLLTLIWFIISFMESFLVRFFYDEGNGLFSVALLLVVNLCIQLITLKICNRRIISFFGAFIVFMYLFHFGQVFSTAFFSNVDFDTMNYLVVYMKEKDYALKSIEICLNTINFFFIGGVLSSDSIDYSDKRETADSLQICLSYGKILFVISFPFRLFFDIERFLIAARSGYSGVINERVVLPGVFSTIASFWYISLAILLIGITDKRKESKIIIYSTIYMVVTMLSGERGHQLICMISLVIIFIQKNNIIIGCKKILSYSAVGVIMLFFIDLVFDIRQYSISYFISNFSEFTSNVLKKNVIIETIHSFGATIFTPYLVVKGMGTDYNPLFGETFIKSTSQIFPAVTDSMRAINNGSILGRALNTDHAIGGSFAAELYYDFRGFYFVASALLGYIYGRFSSSLPYYIQNRDGYRICKIVPYMIYSLWWIRDSVGNITRPIVWLLLVLFIISHYSFARSKTVLQGEPYAKKNSI